MEKYNIFRFKVPIIDLAQEIMTDLLNADNFESLMFEIAHVRNFDKIQKDVPQIDLKKYKFERYYDHMINMDWVSKDTKTIHLLSNLGTSWKYSNPNLSHSLSREEFTTLFEYLKLSKPDYSTIMLVIDGIDWSMSNAKQQVGCGTYGYEKAKSSFDAGENYLSNSCIISKVGTDKNFILTLSCSDNFKESPYFQRLIKQFEPPMDSRIAYAPSNNDERIEWDRMYKSAKHKYFTVFESLSEVILKLPHKFESVYLYPEQTPKETINVIKIAKKILCAKGWIMLPNKHPDFKGTPFMKKISHGKNNAELTMFINATHRGHYLQLEIEYKSIFFSFNNNINYTYELKSLFDVTKYVENISVIGDYIYHALGG